MKLVRLIAVGLAILLALVALLAGLASLPAVQTRLVRQWLARQTAFQGSVERVQIGWRHATCTQLKFVGPGWTFNLPSVVVDLAVPEVAWKSVRVQRFFARGWTLDLSTPNAAISQTSASSNKRAALPLATLGLAQVDLTALSKNSAAAAFRGIFPLLDLPVALSVAHVDLAGEIVFRSQTNGPLERIHVITTGGGLGPRQTARFEMSGRADVPGLSRPVQAVSAQAIWQLHQSSSRRFDRVQLSMKLNAAGPRIDSAAHLFLQADAAREGDGEVYTFAARSGEQANAKQLARIQAAFPNERRGVTGTWTLDARDEDFAPFLLGAPLPSFAIKGSGQLDAEASFQELHAAGAFTGKVGRWDVLAPSLGVLGELNVRGDFDVIQNGRDLRINRLLVEAADTQPIFSLEALQGIEINGATGELKVADPRRDLVRMSFSAVPLAWLRPWLGECSVDGGALRGELIGRARDGGLSVRGLEPLRAQNFSVRRADWSILRNVDLSLALEGTYSPGGWQADVSELELRTNSAPFFFTQGKFGQATGKGATLKAEGHYRFDLVRAAQQPLFNAFSSLTAGSAEGDFTAVLAGVRQFAASVELKNLAGTDSSSAPSGSLRVRADLQPSGLLKLQIPFQVRHGAKRSDGQVSAEIHREGAERVFEAQLTGASLALEDAAGLVAWCSASPRTASASIHAIAARSVWPSAIPIWAGYRGRLQFALTHAFYASRIEIAQVAGRLDVRDNTLALHQLTAQLPGGGTARLNSTISFLANAPQPYELMGELDINQVSAQRFLAVMEADRAPAIEGAFDAATTFSGRAGSLDRLGDALSEDTKLTSRAGVFRGFAAGAQTVDLEKFQKTASRVGAILQAAAGMVGYGPGVSYSDKLHAAAEALRGFSEIHFDQLSLEFMQEPGRPAKIADLSLISPEIRFVGSGTAITNGGAWDTWPLHLEIALGVRGKQADNLKKLGLVGSDQDALGYVPLWTKLPIDGTANELAAEALANLFNRSLAK